MNAFVDLFEQTLERGLAEITRSEAQIPAVEDEPTAMNRFEQGQIDGLVTQLFVPGPLRRLHRVVFAPVDEETEIDFLCRRVSETLAAQISGTVCLVRQEAALEESKNSGALDVEHAHALGLKKLSQQLSHNLWKIPASIFGGESNNHFSARSLETTMKEIALEFDYAVIQAPVVTCSGLAEQVGHLSDGLVLVLRANSTRRASAMSVKERLSAARITILGTVLTDRLFPIPEGIYRRV